MTMMRILLVLLFVCVAWPVMAAEPYKVENVKISMKGVNPVEARDKARNAGQMKAFKALFKGLNEGESVPFDAARVPGLVKDFELVDEQIAPDRYAATYTFSFDRNATREFLREALYAQKGPAEAGGADTSGMPYGTAGYNGVNAPEGADTSSSSPRYSELFGDSYPSDVSGASPDSTSPYAAPPQPHAPLLLPYWKAGDNITIWGQGNLWRNTWSRLERQANSQSAFVLPIGDLSDMRVTTHALPEKTEEISQLLSRYQTENIVVAVGQQAMSSITTTLYKADRTGLIFWKVIDSPMGPSSDPYSIAAGQVMAEIRGGVSSTMAARTPQREDIVIPAEDAKPFYLEAGQVASATIRAESRFNSPQEWLRLKANMIPENGIFKMRVLSLTPRSAVVEMHLSRPFPQVQRELGVHSVALKETGNENGGYIVRFMGS